MGRSVLGWVCVCAQLSIPVPRFLFWVVLTPLLISSSGLVCIERTGDTRLASLDLGVLGVNRLGFDPMVRVYDLWLPEGATTATVRAVTMDPAAYATWYVQRGDGVGVSGGIGVGGGRFTIDLPPDGHLLLVGVYPPGGAIDKYTVTINPACTEGVPCSDGNECTADYCDPMTEQCVLTPVADGVACDFGGLPGGMCASGTCEEGQPRHPNELGPYKIGYTTFVAEDPARVIDPDALTAPKWMLGEDGNWPLYIRVMYPADDEASGPSLMYSPDNPLYPGPLTTGSSYPSTYGALADVPVANPPPGSNGFPMVVYSPGRTFNGLLALEDAHEILASHGFVVALIDHTADVLRSIKTTDPDLSWDSRCPLSGTNHVACRTPDVPFAIDVMLDRNADPNDLFHLSIDPDAIGLEGESAGFGTILAATAGVDELGLVSAGIIPDDRVKAIFPADGRLNGVTEESFSAIQVPVFAFTGRHPERRGAATSLLTNAATPPAYKMGSWINGAHGSVGGDVCTWRARVLDAVEAETATSWDTSETRTYGGESVFEHCPASIFEGHTPEDIALVGFSASAIPEDMPTGIPQSELYRLKIFYLVAFFETYLAEKDYYARFLTEEYAEQNEPLIHFGVGEFPGVP